MYNQLYDYDFNKVCTVATMTQSVHKNTSAIMN